MAPPRMQPPGPQRNPVPPPLAQPPRQLLASKGPYWLNWHQETQITWAPTHLACRPNRRLPRTKPLDNSSAMRSAMAHPQQMRLQGQRLSQILPPMTPHRMQGHRALGRQSRKLQMQAQRKQ